MRQRLLLIYGCALFVIGIRSMCLAQDDEIVIALTHDGQNIARRINKGQQVRLDCSRISGNLTGRESFFWSVVGMTSSFSMDAETIVTPEADIAYQCIAFALFGKSQLVPVGIGTVTIIIKDPPIIATPNQPPTVTDNGIKVMIGNDTCISNSFMGMVNFTCVVVSGRAGITISWLVGGEVFMNNNHSMVISINDTASNLIVGVDNGASIDRNLNNYTCIASNSDGTDTVVSILSICEAAPVIEKGNFTVGCPLSQGNIGGNYSNVTGEQVRIYCRLIDGFLIPNINWFYMNSELIVFRNNSVIDITVQNDAVGEYTCVATNMLGMDSASSFVDIQFPPMINGSLGLTNNISVNLYEINVGEDPNVQVPFNITNVILYCVVSGRERPIINWTVPPLDNKTFNIETSVAMDGVLFVVTSLFNITNFTNDHAGIYQCNVSNCAGQDGVNIAIYTTQVAELSFINGTYEFYEDQDLVCINLTLNKPAPCNMTVEVIEESVTATRGLDYESGPYSVNFAKGDKSAKFYINITDDNELEMNEEFTLRINKSALCPDVSLAKPYETKVIIIDNEYEFCFEQNTYIFHESIGEAELFLKLSRTLRRDIMVSFRYDDLTAFGNGTVLSNNTDYYTSYALPDKAIIPAGTTEFLLKVKIVNDKRLEENEIFRIYPDDHFHCSADVIIFDDDDFRFTFEEAMYFVREGHDVAVKLLLIYPEEYYRFIFPIAVNIDEINITATGGSTNADGIDFIYQNYSLSFKDGETSKTLIARTIDDDIIELDETYSLSINIVIPIPHVIVGENSTTTITIKNDDYCSLTVVNGSIKHNNRRRRTTLKFSSDGDPIVTYECKLDDKKFKDCKSPKVWKNLKKGRHVATVKAFCTDDKGNRSTTKRRKFNFQIR